MNPLTSKRAANDTREREQLVWTGSDWGEPQATLVRSSDVALSPSWIAEWLGTWATLDPCGHPRQLVFARKIISLPDDGLALPWVARWLSLRSLGRSLFRSPADVPFRVWCNPPYSRPGAWVVSALAAVRDGASVVLMLRFDISTGWARAAIDGVDRHGGWVACSRARERFGAIDAANASSEPVYGAAAPFLSLLVAIGPDVPPPPRERVLVFEARPRVLPARRDIRLYPECDDLRDSIERGTFG